jgi:hypothetical protein
MRILYRGITRGYDSISTQGREANRMKSIQVDKDIVDHLLTHASNPGETAAEILRRELRIPQAQVLLDIDEDTYAFIASRSLAIGESASSILRRELHLSGPQPPANPNEPPGGPDPHAPPNTGPETLVFRIAAGTGSGAWNSRETMLVGRKGDTLRITNDDTVDHQLHTSGAPFPHPSMYTPPSQSSDFVLQTTYDPVQQGPLYDHMQGQQAQFWLRVVDNA